MNVPKLVFDCFLKELDNVDKWQEEGLHEFHEVHLALPVGRTLLDGKADYVVLEGRPPGYVGRERCDLFARIGKETWYVEVKKGWHGVGWNNKPKFQLTRCLDDLWKLHRVKAVEHRVFALMHFRHGELTEECPVLDEDFIATTADRMARQLKAGRVPDVPKITYNPFLVLELIERVMRKLGPVRSLSNPRVGVDHIRSEKCMENRVLVLSF